MAEEVSEVGEDKPEVGRIGHQGWVGIIRAVTGWIQLLTLMVLVVESILLYTLYKSDASDHQRIWYIIAMLGFFSLVVVAVFFDRYTQKVKSAQKDVGLNKALASAGQLMSDRYGVVAEELCMKVEIFDLNGTTKITRSWSSLKIILDFPIPYLPGKLNTDKPGHITLPARLTSYNFTDSNKDVQLRDVETDGNTSKFKFEIVGGFYKDDGDLDYTYESEATQMFRMSKEEMEVAYGNSLFPYELMSLTPDIVVNELRIEIIYPSDFVVTPHPGVFYGQTEIMHNQELRKVKFGFNNQRASYIVKEPLIGLTYFVFWTPPSRKM